jgi:hypothetical protein
MNVAGADVVVVADERPSWIADDQVGVAITVDVAVS